MSRLRFVFAALAALAFGSTATAADIKLPDWNFSVGAAHDVRVVDDRSGLGPRVQPVQPGRGVRQVPRDEHQGGERERDGLHGAHEPPPNSPLRHDETAERPA